MDRYVFKNCDLIELNYSLEADTYILYENIEVECVKFDKKYNDIEIFISIDNENYEKLDFKNNIYLDYEDNFVVRVGKNIKSLKINHFDKVLGIYKKKYKGLILSTRSDGFGCRMVSIINSIYLSKKTGFKFGFVWDELNNGEEHSVFVPKEDMVFDDLFIKEYSYTRNLDLERFSFPKKYEFYSLKDLVLHNYSRYWGVYNSEVVNLRDFVEDIDSVDYANALNLIWERFGFKKCYKDIIRKAGYKSKYILNDNFISIHIRSGDIVFQPTYRKFKLHPIVIRKATPYELALAVSIELLNQGNVVLFSDNTDIVNNIIDYIKKNYCFKNKIVSVDDLYDEKNANSFDRVIFEISLMSKSKGIYANVGGFVLLPSMIGNVYFYDYLKLFDCKKQIDIINSIKLDNVNTVQQSITYSYLFFLHIKAKSNLEDLSKVLIYAIQYDNSLIYYVFLFDIRLKQKLLFDAEMIIKQNIHCLNEFIFLYKEATFWDYKTICGVDYDINYKRSYWLLNNHCLYLSLFCSYVSLYEKDIVSAYDFCKKALKLKQAKRLFVRLFRKKYTYLFKKLFRKSND